MKYIYRATGSKIVLKVIGSVVTTTNYRLNN
jgi:hypothetical protein